MLDESIKARLGTQSLTDDLGRILFELICKRYVLVTKCENIC